MTRSDTGVGPGRAWRRGGEKSGEARFEERAAAMSVRAARRQDTADGFTSTPRCCLAGEDAAVSAPGARTGAGNVPRCAEQCSRCLSEGERASDCGHSCVLAVWQSRSACGLGVGSGAAILARPDADADAAAAAGGKPALARAQERWAIAQRAVRVSTMGARSAGRASRFCSYETLPFRQSAAESLMTNGGAAHLQGPRTARATNEGQRR